MCFGVTKLEFDQDNHDELGKNDLDWSVWLGETMKYHAGKFDEYGYDKLNNVGDSVECIVDRRNG